MIKQKTSHLGCFLFYHATGLGLEPRLAEPETAVLPLDDPVIFNINLYYHKIIQKQLEFIYF